MTRALARRENNVARVPALTMANRFGNYTPEEEKAVRKVEVVEDEALKQLNNAWKNPHKAYKEMVSLVQKLSYSASDVEKFSVAFIELQKGIGLQKGWDPNRLGFFLSILINEGKGQDYTIPTRHLAVPIDHFGYFNKPKNVTINGDAGEACGGHMEDGSIIVEGNVGDVCGYCMTGGSIMVKGNAGVGVGHCMKGGLLVVNGDAGNNVGHSMKGGEIHINGDIGSIPDNIENGKIFHKGELIVDK
jgi:hypothetical protein